MCLKQVQDEFVKRLETEAIQVPEAPEIERERKIETPSACQNKQSYIKGKRKMAKN